MTMSTKRCHEAAKIMQAYAEGKTVEVKDRLIDGKWVVTEKPRWDWFKFDYRVKPDTVTVTLTIFRNTTTGHLFAIQGDHYEGMGHQEVIKTIEVEI